MASTLPTLNRPNPKWLVLSSKNIATIPATGNQTNPSATFSKHTTLWASKAIDTRAVVRHTREKGAMKGVLSTTDLDPDSLIQKAKDYPGLVGRDLVKGVTCKEPYHWTEGLHDLNKNEKTHLKGQAKYKIAAYDFGIKQNILRYLVDRGCDVTVFPADAPAEDLLAIDPDGIFLSNGPGDPEPVTYAIENIQKLSTERPMFGICLGHQLMSLALGGFYV